MLRYTPRRGGFPFLKPQNKNQRFFLLFSFIWLLLRIEKKTMASKLSISLASPSSASSLHRNPHALSSPSFLFGTSLKVGLCSEIPRIFAIRCHDKNSGSETPSVTSGAIGSRKSTNLGEPEPKTSSASAIDFLTLCHSLKTTKRTGWVNHGIKGSESISDHMYRMSLMALIAGDIPGVNRERCIKIAIVHDIAEAIVGDITPHDGVPKAEKSRREQAALDEMCEVLGGGLRAEEIQELWAEYENNSSIEANLVKDFDKVELILQALEYEMDHGKVLDEFYLSTEGKFQTEIGKSWAAEILSRRHSWLNRNSV